MTHEPSALAPDLIDVAAGRLLHAFEDGSDIDDLAPDCSPQSLEAAGVSRTRWSTSLAAMANARSGSCNPTVSQAVLPRPPNSIWAVLDLSRLAMTLSIDEQVAAWAWAGPAQDRMLAAGGRDGSRTPAGTKVLVAVQRSRRKIRTAPGPQP